MSKNDTNGKAFHALLNDLVENILRFADNPGGCAEYITSQIRELIGVRLVALVSYDPENNPQLVGISPHKKEAEWRQPGITEFVTRAMIFDMPRIIDPARDPEGAGLLSAGIGRSFVIPLSVGEDRVGMLIMLHLLDDAGAAIILDAHIRVSRILALILKNSMVYRVLEHTVAARTGELAKSEKLFRTLFEQSGVGVAQISSTTGRFIRINKKYCDILGYTPEEATSLDFQTVTHPDDLQPDLENMQLLRSGSIRGFTMDKRYIRRDGAAVWVTLSVSAMWDIGAEPDYHIAVVTDITARKAAEDALRESTARLNFVMEASNIGAWELDLDDHSMHRSPEHDRIFGYDELQPRWTYEIFLEHVLPEDRTMVDGKFRQAVLTHTDWKFECRIRRVNGEIRWIWKAGRHQMHESEIIPRMAGILLDITERKQAEDSRLKYEQQLQQNQRLEALGILAGGIAHDFNNLMSGIFGYIDLAMIENDRNRATELLSKAMKTMDRARGLTQQLLTFSKGGAPIQKVTSLIPFIQETAQFAVSGSNVLCRCDIPDDLWQCDIDKNQVAQVIDNIVINAQQAMPGGGTIEIQARNIPHGRTEHSLLTDGNYVRISVKDNGIGIPKEILPRIFDPFYTTKSTGHGLGLATCYSIIKRHSGAIDIESEPGKGSTFHIYLPAVTDTVSTAPQERTTAAKGSGTILIMDDEDVVLDTLGNMLEALGYTVICTGNGMEALERFLSERAAGRSCAAIILDLTVPGAMGGKDAAAEIRKTDPDIPVFVASGYADDPIIKNPTRYGFTASIGKPFQRTELAEMLERHVHTHHG
ncbi:MAG: PAS domain S-box protein [Spirochaetes bacterium]|nr:PAS domain S-box protein [Spirochaetota bacterium]